MQSSKPLLNFNFDFAVINLEIFSFKHSSLHYFLINTINYALSTQVFSFDKTDVHHLDKLKIDFYVLKEVTKNRFFGPKYRFRKYYASCVELEMSLKKDMQSKNVNLRLEVAF